MRATFFGILIYAFWAGGCQTTPRGATLSGTPPGLYLGGDIVFKEGKAVEKLYIENRGNDDLIIGDNVFLGSWFFEVPNGPFVGSGWDQIASPHHYVILHPVKHNGNVYWSEEQVCLEVPLEDEMHVIGKIAGHIKFNLSGYKLIVENGKIVDTPYDLSLEQQVPPGRAPSTSSR